MDISLFCLEVTNTFVLPSWPGACYLAGARVNQWVWHRKRMTIITSILECCEQSASQITNQVVQKCKLWSLIVKVLYSLGQLLISLVVL